MFKAFFVGLYHRLWLSYRSTLLGLLVAAAAESLAYFGSTQGVPPYIHALIGLVAAPFLMWKDQAVKDGTIKLLVALFLVSSLSACAFFQKVEAVAEACSSELIQTGIDILETVAGDQAALAQFTAQLGPDAKCVAQAIAGLRASVADAGTATTATLVATHPLAQQRAALWLANHDIGGAK